MPSICLQTRLQNQMEANKGKMLTKYLEKQRRVRENIMLELQRGPSKVSWGWGTLHIVLAAYCCMCVQAPISSQVPLVYIVYRPQVAPPSLTISRIMPVMFPSSKCCRGWLYTLQPCICEISEFILSSCTKMYFSAFLFYFSAASYKLKVWFMGEYLCISAPIDLDDISLLGMNFAHLWMYQYFW